MLRKRWWLSVERLISSPYPVLSLTAITVFASFFLLLGLPLYKSLSNQNSIPKGPSFSPDSEYILGDLEKSPNGTYDFKSANQMEWPSLSTWVDSDALIRIAKSPVVWIRVNGVEQSLTDQEFLLLDHSGAVFEVYHDNGRLLFKFGKAENLPKLLDADYSWIPLGTERTQYYYIRVLHRKGHLFTINPAQYQVGNQTLILDKFAKSNLLSLYLYSFFVIIGLVCFLVYLTQFQKKYFTLLDFSIFTFTIGLLGITTNGYIRYLSIDRYSIYLISTICSNIVYIPMHSGLKRIFGAGKYNILNILIILNFVFGIFSIALGFTINDSPIVMNIFLHLRIFYIVFAIVNFLGPIVVAYFAWKRGSEIGLGHLIGFSLTLVLVLIEIYVSIQDQTSFSGVAYWGVLFGVFAQGLALEKIFFANRTKIKEFEASLLIAEKSLREVQLKTLQTKLNPHYLFNSLNTIHALQQTKSELVGDAILRLANNYRFLSDRTELDLIPFEEEWEFVEDFLHLQKLRFFDTVKIHLNKEGNFQNVKIPPLTLQPIVENSFKHGFRNSSSANWMIDISAKFDSKGTLTLKISDSGAGISEEKLQDEAAIWGRSLGNIKARLSHHYKYSKVTIAKNNPSGIITTIILE